MSPRVCSVIHRALLGFPTNLSLWVTLFSLEYHIIVRAESEVAAFAPERRQVPAVFTLGTAGPFQVEPDSEPNARAELCTGLSELTDVFGAEVSVSVSGLAHGWNRRERRIGVSVGSLEARYHRLDLINYPTRTGNLLRYCDRHGIADDLDQLAILIWLTDQDSGVATPAQGKSCTIMKDSVRVPRTLNVEVHVTLKRCPDLPVQDEPQLESNVNKLKV